MQKSKIWVLTFAGVIAITFSACNQVTPTGSESAEQQQPSKTSSAGTPTSTSSQDGDKLVSDPSGNLNCEAIFTPQDLYELNPNLALIPDVRLGLTPATKEIESLGGVECQISNLSSASDTEIAIVKLTSISAAYQSGALSSAGLYAPQEIGDDLVSYFDFSEGVGQLQFVYKNYWVAIASTSIRDGLQASALAGIVKANLPN